MWITALSGPLGLGIITFHVSPDANAQYVGGEIVMVIVGCLLVGVAALGASSPVGDVVRIGSGLFITYTFVTVIVGQDYVR